MTIKKTTIILLLTCVSTICYAYVNVCQWTNSYGYTYQIQYEGLYAGFQILGFHTNILMALGLNTIIPKIMAQLTLATFLVVIQLNLNFMKRTILMLLPIFLIQCGTEKGQPIAKTNVQEFENIKPIEPYVYADNNGFENKFFEFASFRSLKTAADWKNLKDWESIDEALRAKIESYKSTPGYSLCIQTLSMKFLDKYLIQTVRSDKQIESVKYYLEVLIQEKNPHWPVLTKSFLFIKDQLDINTIAKVKTYIITSASSYVKENRPLLESRSAIPTNTYEFVQKRLSEAQESIRLLSQ